MKTPRTPHTPRRSHMRLLLICLAALCTSVAVTVAAVPLYNLFCKHFGIPQPKVLTGPTVEAPMPANTTGRTVTVRFTANTASDMPVNFQPQIFSVKVKLGEPMLTAFTAQNQTGQAFDGVAVHMLYAMGGRAGGADISPYVELQQCFCFEQEHYPAHANLQLPLSFVIRPDLPEGIHTITFAYTLFKATPNDPRIKGSHTNEKAG